MCLPVCVVGHFCFICRNSECEIYKPFLPCRWACGGGSCQPVLGFLVLGGEVFSGPHLSLTSDVVAAYVAGVWENDKQIWSHTTKRESLQGNMIPGWVFVRRNSLCVCECVKEGLGGPGWLLKWGVLKGFYFARLLFAFLYTVHYCLCKRIKQWSIFSPEVYCCIFVLQLQGENVDEHQNLGLDDGIQPHYYFFFFFFKICAFYFFIVVSNT